MAVLVGKRGDELRASPEGAFVLFQQVSALSGGGFVTTWWQDGQGLTAQRFDADGAAVGAPIVVSAAENGYVAGLASDGFVVASKADADNHVYANLYDSSGAPVGNAILVTNDAPSFGHINVFALAGGGFVVTWIVSAGFDDPDSADIRAQVFEADGDPVGDVIEVNDVTTGTQDSPAGVGLAGGGFVLMWTDYEPAGDDPDGAVRGQLFDSTGTAVGVNFLVNTDVTNGQSSPDLAALPGGGFVATWQSYEPDPADPEFGIGTSEARAQIFDAAGAKVGDELLASTPRHDVSPPSVTALGWGGFMIAWDDLAAPFFNDPSHHAQLFDGQGNRLGDQIEVNSVPSDFNGRIQLTTLASGEIVAMWKNDNFEADPADVGMKTQILLMPTVGTTGDDILPGTGDDDRIAALAGDDEVDGGGGHDVVDGGAGQDEVDGGAGDDILDGGAGDDTLSGGGDDDLLVGGAGSDALWGGAEGSNLGRADGTDTADYSAATDAITVTLGGTNASPTIIVTEPAEPSATSDTLVSIERIVGTGEHDALVVEAFGAALAARLDHVDLGGGYDSADFSALAAVTLNLRDPAGQLVTVGTSSLLLKNVEAFVGTDGADTILGAGALSGMAVDAGAGDDVARIVPAGFALPALDLDLGTGNDHLIVDYSGTFGRVGMSELTVPVATDGLNASVDIESFPAFTVLGANRLTIKTGFGDDMLVGTAGDDRFETAGGWDWIRAGAGNDYIDGGIESDVMQGGAGDDTYVVDNMFDFADEDEEGGTDTVRSSITYTMQAEVENLLLTGNAAIGGTGNALANNITGNAAANAINGAAGNDRIDGGDGADDMAGGTGDDVFIVDDKDDQATENAGEGADTVRSSASYQLSAHVEALVLTGSLGISGTGNGGANSLIGNGAGNRLDGGAGADQMAGGGGNDLYLVDDAGDNVVELAGGGTDTVESRIDHALDDQVERLTLTGSAAIDGTGNGLANILTGNAAANVLNGGAGADTLKGGNGGDLYIVDVAGDVVVELAGQGTDTVRSSAASYTLSGHVEQLILGGGGNIEGSGNALANMITGNGGNNRLDGKGGGDTMAGGTGHDTYVVDSAGDQVIEGGSSGNDTVESRISYTLPTHVEKLVLVGSAAVEGRGNAGDNRLTGNGVSNVLSGGRGDDRIDGGGSNDQIFGGGGDDILSGGSGGDRFYFNGALGAGNVDRILDFSAPADSFYLHRSVFAGTGPNGTLAASAFHQGAAAADAGDRILYEAATGNIFYDADGTGAAAAILFASVAPGTALTHADFVIYG